MISVSLSKKEELDVDPRAIKQIEFYGMSRTNSEVCTILEKTKETVLEFSDGTAKVF